MKQVVDLLRNRFYELEQSLESYPKMIANAEASVSRLKSEFLELQTEAEQFRKAIETLATKVV